MIHHLETITLPAVYWRTITTEDFPMEKKTSTCCLIIEVVMGELRPQPTPLSNQISLIHSGKRRVKFAFVSCLESEGTHGSSHSGLALLNFTK